jgi:hypothetical protein
MDKEKPQVIEISENTQRVFSFKKMALGWLVVILAIVILCIIVEVAVYGW